MGAFLRAAMMAMATLLQMPHDHHQKDSLLKAQQQQQPSCHQEPQERLLSQVYHHF